MNHQPFESWILDEYPVSDDQKDSLSHHLNECAECSKLKESWTLAHKTLSSASIKPAPANFTRNWQASLAARKRLQEKNQARTLVISLGSSAVAILIFLSALLLPDFSLISVVVGFLSTIVNLLNGLENFWSIMTRLVQAIPASTLIITGILLSSWIILACLAWGLSIWKLAFKRGLKK